MCCFEDDVEHCFIKKQQQNPTKPFGSNVKNVLQLEMIESQVNSSFPRSVRDVES